MAVVYHGRGNRKLVVEEFLEESLVLVSTVPRKLNRGWTPGYVFVNWSDAFQARHREAFTDSPPPRLSIGSAGVALDHVLSQGGSGYFLESQVADLVFNGKLHYVEDAPVFRHRSYIIYPIESGVREAVDIALSGLRSVVNLPVRCPVST